MLGKLFFVASLSVSLFLWRTPSANAGPPPKPSPETKYREPIDFCGDGICSGFDECSTCPEDCGFSCQPSFCGDGICQSGESCSTCSADCGSCGENRWVVVSGPFGSKRYWPDYAGNAILRSNLDGSQSEVVRYVSGPYGISYDPSTGYLIWTSSNDETVQAALADGSGGTITLESAFDEEGSAIVLPQQGDYQIAYGIADGQILKVTQNVNTGEEQRETLLQLSSTDAVLGLALTPDHTALYLGDTVGRMSQKLNLSSHSVEPLAFSEGGGQTLSFASPQHRLSICSKPLFPEVAR
jgi:DNA-binding beta-propeller fold protein YncE